MEAAEVTEAKPCRGYSEPPWKFQGSALYQFHLVKSDVAKALIPREFKLVEAFGYTLGGFFLARYDDSPVGAFDELVVIAGIVWNPPTSCAWAARVLVSSKEACVHGRKDVGLPSHVANFSKAGGYPKHRIVAVNRKQEEDKTFGFLRRFGMPSSVEDVHEATQVNEFSSLASSNLFSINLINTVPLDSRGWMGPPVKMSLPSFSGRTEDNPNLLKYSCQMACRARIMPPLKVITPYAIKELGSKSSGTVTCEGEEESSITCRSRLSLMVMLSKPILSLELNSMEMNVEAPVVLSK